MSIPKSCIDLVKSFEGYCERLPDGRCKAYAEVINGKRDKWTIGWGSTRGVTEGLIWTKSEAEEGLQRELAIHAERVNRLVTIQLNENERAALISFDYNCGGLTDDNGRPTNTLRAINTGDRRKAADAISQWNKFNKKLSKGLVHRRAAEVALWLKPVDEPKPDFMPQQPDKPGLTTGQQTAVAASAVGGGSILTTFAADPQAAIDTATKAATAANNLPPIALIAAILVAGGLAAFWLYRRSA